MDKNLPSYFYGSWSRKVPNPNKKRLSRLKQKYGLAYIGFFWPRLFRRRPHFSNTFLSFADFEIKFENEAAKKLFCFLQRKFLSTTKIVSETLTGIYKIGIGYIDRENVKFNSLFIIFMNMSLVFWEFSQFSLMKFTNCDNYFVYNV